MALRSFSESVRIANIHILATLCRVIHPRRLFFIVARPSRRFERPNAPRAQFVDHPVQIFSLLAEISAEPRWSILAAIAGQVISFPPVHERDEETDQLLRILKV